MDYSLKIENLTKCYRLGQPVANPYNTLRDEMIRRGQIWTKQIFGKNQKSPVNESNNTLWALQGVSFTAQPGEVIGVVGRNGAGKSTLLKILSRITEPTSGNIQIRGKLASLLEVGTGFHPELTGRENIFLNGALLGMKKQEIQRKFDAIVDFSQIERFIDTPVKRYSSGMYVRLAFSVAAHLEPDVLVLDEVLAVGDLAFQKKCTGMMKEVASQNRTVLFVSHNLSLIRSMCSRVILLDQGKVVMDDVTEAVLPEFVRLLQNSKSENTKRSLYADPGKVARISKVGFYNKLEEPSWIIPMGEKAHLAIEYEILTPIPGISVCVVIKNPLSVDVVAAIKERITTEKLKEGEKRTVHIEFPSMPLHPFEYGIEISIGNTEGDQVYDRAGTEGDLPLLSVTSEEADPQKRQGYFTVPIKVSEVFS